MNKKYLIVLTLLVGLSLSACAPQTTQGAPATGSTITLDTPEAVAVNRAALEAWHLMELARLQTGQYTTNALVDLTPPQGVQWRVEGFSGDAYTLRFVSSNVSNLEWLVTPEGVSAVRVAGQDASS